MFHFATRCTLTQQTLRVIPQLTSVIVVVNDLVAAEGMKGLQMKTKFRHSFSFYMALLRLHEWIMMMMMMMMMRDDEG